MLKRRPVKVDGLCLKKDEAAKLASLRQCSVSQAAEVAVALNYVGEDDDDLKKKMRKAYFKCSSQDRTGA